MNSITYHREVELDKDAVLVPKSILDKEIQMEINIRCGVKDAQQDVFVDYNGYYAFIYLLIEGNPSNYPYDRIDILIN